MTLFNPEQILNHYRELNLAEDQLGLQGRLEEAQSIHERLLELEQEAKQNGYRLVVRADSAWCSQYEETCFIEPIKQE